MNNLNPVYLLETIINTVKVKKPIKYTFGLLNRQTEVPIALSHKSARKLNGDFGEIGDLARRMKRSGSSGVNGRKSGLVLKYMLDPSTQSKAEELYSILSKLPASASLPKEYWASINEVGAYVNGFKKEAIIKLLQKRLGKKDWPYNDVVAALNGFSSPQIHLDYLRSIHTY